MTVDQLQSMSMLTRHGRDDVDRLRADEMNAAAIQEAKRMANELGRLLEIHPKGFSPSIS